MRLGYAASSVHSSVYWIDPADPERMFCKRISCKAKESRFIVMMFLLEIMYRNSIRLIVLICYFKDFITID